MMRTLFLHPPSFEGFDGGAGARYQTRREIKSFWYPTWLAQPAALVPNSKLVDAPAARLSLADVLPMANDFELAVLHTSSPSFTGDIRVAEALKRANPSLLIGMVGAAVAVEPEKSLLASTALDFVAREEFDFTIAEVAESRPLEDNRRPDLSGRRRSCGGQPRPGHARGHGPASVCPRCLQAGFACRGLLQRLSPAPVRLVLYGPRMPLEVHLLPLAADRRWPLISRAKRRTCVGRGCAHPQVLPPSEGAVLRRRHLH